MDLNASQRRSSATVVTGPPGHRQYKFPIPDAAHARAALGRINQAKPPLTPAQRAAVLRAVRKKLGQNAGR